MSVAQQSPITSSQPRMGFLRSSRLQVMIGTGRASSRHSSRSRYYSHCGKRCGQSTYTIDSIDFKRV